MQGHVGREHAPQFADDLKRFLAQIPSGDDEQGGLFQNHLEPDFPLPLDAALSVKPPG